MDAMKFIFKIIMLLCALTILTSCGFTLRSSQPLPPQLHKIYLQTDNPYDQLAITLKKAFKASGIIVVDDANTNPLIFHLTSNYNYSNISPATSAQARIYTLVLNITFSITDIHGKTIVDINNVSASRNISLAPNEIFEVSNQVEVVKQELQQEAVIKIFNILSSKKVFAAFNELDIYHS